MFSPGGSAGANRIGRGPSSRLAILHRYLIDLTRLQPSGNPPSLSAEGQRPRGDSSACPSSTMTTPISGCSATIRRGRLGTEQVEGRREGVGLGRGRGQHRHARRSVRGLAGPRVEDVAVDPAVRLEVLERAPEVPRPRFRSRSTPSGVSGSNGFRSATSQRPPNRPGGEPSANRLDWPPWTRAEVGQPVPPDHVDRPVDRVTLADAPEVDHASRGGRRRRSALGGSSRRWCQPVRARASARVSGSGTRFGPADEPPGLRQGARRHVVGPAGLPGSSSTARSSSPNSPARPRPGRDGRSRSAG